MGLTVHYDLHAGNQVSPPEILEPIRQVALDLPVTSVSELVHFTGAEADYQALNRDDPWRWALIQARATVHLNDAGRHTSAAESPRYLLEVKPIEVYLFSVQPGPGCEPMNIGLARYPKTTEFSSNRISPPITVNTRRGSGWHWRSFCKTQYASAVSNENFLRCHLAVTALLDAVASQPQLKLIVDDEGDFYVDRDVDHLLQEVGSSNAMIAALTAAIMEHAEVDAALSPIQNHPDYPGLPGVGYIANQLHGSGLVTVIKALVDSNPELATNNNSDLSI